MSKYARGIVVLFALLLVFWIDYLSTRPWSHAAAENPAALPVENSQPVVDEDSDGVLIPNTGASAVPLPVSTATSAPATLPAPSGAGSPSQSPSRAPTKTATSVPSLVPSLTPEQSNLLPANRWREWPVMPGLVSQELRSAYLSAVALGKIDPHAFSILGDCQGEAEAYLGVFDSSPGLVQTMADDLQAIVRQFAGSFNRYNPAAKSGSSPSSLLYAPWNDNKEGKCTKGETPLDCELRVHRPSIVFIQLGTHFETPDRNYAYFTTIIKKVKETGAVPVMVTKADNLEGNFFVNGNIARLAAEYNLPLWNFWSSVQELPDHGLMPDGMHLTKDGNTVHQMGALRVLGAIWQEVQ